MKKVFILTFVTAATCTLLLPLTEGTLSFRRVHCKPPPKLKINGTDIMAKAREKGGITVLSLHDATLEFSIYQAELLEYMANEYKSKGWNVNFVLLNKRGLPAKNIHKIRQRITVNVYQEPSNKDLWKILGGQTDDIFIYDKCGGRLRFFLRRPYSYIGNRLFAWVSIEIYLLLDGFLADLRAKQGDVAYAWFPLDRNGIVKSSDTSQFQLTAQRFLRIYDNNLLGCKSEAISLRSAITNVHYYPSRVCGACPSPAP